MRRALITGGAGFIGSHLVRKLVNSGNIVLNYDKLTYSGRLENLQDLQANLSYKFVKGDIVDNALFLDCLNSFKPTVIFHLAAETHVDRSIDSCGVFVKTNVEGTYKILQETLNYYLTLTPWERDNFRFIHVSTDEVFGTLGETGCFFEESPYQPNSPYSASKAASDFFARSFYKTYGLPVIITNCSNNFGPNQYPEKLIPLMIMNAFERKRLPIYGNGLQVRDWLYVEDHIDALIKVAARGKVGHQYCIGGGFEMTNLNIVLSICKIMDKKFPSVAPHCSLVEFVTDRPGHDFRYAICSKKIQTELNWKPIMAFEEALNLTVDWYIDNQAWVNCISRDNLENRNRRGIFDRIEVI